MVAVEISLCASRLASTVALKSADTKRCSHAPGLEPKRLLALPTPNAVCARGCSRSLCVRAHVRLRLCVMSSVAVNGQPGFPNLLTPSN